MFHFGETKDIKLCLLQCVANRIEDNYKKMLRPCSYMQELVKLMYKFPVPLRLLRFSYFTQGCVIRSVLV